MQDFTSITGKGVKGTIDSHSVALGNKALLLSLGIDFTPLSTSAEQLRAKGQTAMFAAIDGKPAAVISVADPIKPTTPEALKQLKAEGLRIVMLTGDSKATAEAIAKQLGIDELEAEVLPERKSEVVRQLQQQGRKVAMAGDGVNDAPALAQAQVGIAMGTGTDVAMESAGVTLVKGDLIGIVRARCLSHATMRNIFHSTSSKSLHISNGTVLMGLRRMGYQNKMTGHGFRTLASTILNEKGYPPDVIERQLAHEDDDKIRAAYNRAEYLLERKKMMQDYADWLDVVRTKIKGDVISLSVRDKNLKFK